jgi:hypothetical protein
MKDLREVAERIGYCKARLEQANADKDTTAIVMYEHEIAILQWVLGDKPEAK